jgi:hypothetical protein
VVPVSFLSWTSTIRIRIGGGDGMGFGRGIDGGIGRGGDAGGKPLFI